MHCNYTERYERIIRGSRSTLIEKTIIDWSKRGTRSEQKLKTECWTTTTSGTTRAPRPCTTHRAATRTRHPPRTAHGRRPAHSNGARVERAPGLAGRAEVGVCDGADIALPSVLQMIYKRISINSAAIPLRATIPRRQSRAEQSRAAIQSSSMANINCFQDASLHINHSPISQYLPIP